MRTCLADSSEVDADPMRLHKEWGVLDETSEQPGFGACLWNVEANKMCRTTLQNGARTVVDILEKSRDAFRDKRAVGFRKVVKVHEVEEGGAKREKVEMTNEYSWLTYGQYYERALCLARGFMFIGMQPRDKLVIYAETQRDWMTVALATFFLNAQVVTIYATLGEDGAVHGINETEAKFIVADSKLMKTLVKVLPKCDSDSIKAVISMTDFDPTVAEKLRSTGLEAHTVERLLESGKTYPLRAERPKPEDIAVIMYTSGTTGLPKGVLISHANIVSCVAGVQHDLKGLISSDDVYLAYLPLAHIMELAAELSFISLGASLGYGSPHTLTDNSVKLKRPESLGDASCLQPTFMVYAPAVLEKIYQAVQARRSQLGLLGKKLFNMGLKSGHRHFSRGQVGANRLLNGIVFKKVQKLVGGRLKAVITGSAPLSPEIQKYIQTVLDVPVRQGYGLTETCAGSCVAFWGDNDVSSVGPPTVSAVIRLADWPEGNYMNSDKDKDGIGVRRGEVLIGGPSVSRGYFINDRRPNEELRKRNEEDWVDISGTRFFRTGDIGQINKNGTLQIIDRKKDLWKGPQGEYVALTKVEAALKLCEFVELPMVYGRTGASHVVALVCPQKVPLLRLAKELGIKSEDIEDLCKDNQLVEKVSEACKAKCKEQQLVEFEIPTGFALVSDPWTPENDLLTAALKLKRPQIVAAHKSDIDKLYA
eukprot:TRINITY_DN22560_c0_g3_i1.p1 TRINITY_DN22560_c0_g3~~TRINITY_DN22560_c0_g3_i1.p1  ORF type:complete len:720 (-),score=92.91 TRINITY_DN22560_c0_g3_i1:373-2490(-)